MQLNRDFNIALQDYLLLMEKGYPQKATLKLVSDKYRLTGVERSILYRGVATGQKVKLRTDKVLDTLPVSGKITIDGFNVLRTIASYLIGRPVYIAMDGFLRDASELHGKPLGQEWRLKAFNLMLELLKEKNCYLEIWFDAPVSKSGETAASVNQLLKQQNIKGKAETAHSADYQLKQQTAGVIATADSAIIEQAKVPVIDLAQMVLKFHYQPSLLDLREVVGKFQDLKVPG
jgi:hypothetical protein